MPVDWVVVGLDNGGTTNNGTILDSGGRFLLDQMAEARGFEPRMGANPNRISSAAP